MTLEQRDTWWKKRFFPILGHMSKQIFLVADDKIEDTTKIFEYHGFDYRRLMGCVNNHNMCIDIDGWDYNHPYLVQLCNTGKEQCWLYEDVLKDIKSTYQEALDTLNTVNIERNDWRTVQGNMIILANTTDEEYPLQSTHDKNGNATLSYQTFLDLASGYILSKNEKS